MRLLFYSLLATFSSVVWALHESDVGVMDWHKHLVGVPLLQSLATAPVFHRVGSKNIILSATMSNVLAALDSDNGTVAWRYIFSAEDRIAGFYKGEQMVATLSGPGGSTLRTFDASTGHLILERQLHHPQEGHLSEPYFLGKHVQFVPGTSNFYSLTNGYTINYFDGDKGEIKWSWSSPDQSSLVIYSKLVITPGTVYAVGLAKSVSSYTIHVTALSADTGEVISSVNIPSSIANFVTDVVTLSLTTSTSPRIAWLEQHTIRSVLLTPKLDEKPSSASKAEYAQLLDVGMSGHGQLVAIRPDGSARIMKLVEKSPGIQAIWEFKDSAASERHTDSIYAGGLDKDGQPYISRVYWSHVVNGGAADTFASHLGAQGLSTAFTFPFDSKTHGILAHVALDTESSTQSVESRLLITTSTGAVQLWEQGKPKWTREEALSTVVLAEFVELPERVISSSRVGNGLEPFLTKVIRQIQDAKGFPSYISNFAKRFITGSYASASSSASSSDRGVLSRDAFGFRQVIVTATMLGKMYGIDSSNGEIIWSKILGLGWTVEVGGKVHPAKMFVIKTVSDGGNPEVVMVGQRRAENSLVDTVLFHVDALTGEDLSGATQKDDGTLAGLDLISGPIIDAYLLSDSPRTIVLLDEFLQVYLYPETEKTQTAFVKLAPLLSMPIRTNNDGSSRIEGHRLALNTEVSDRYVAYPVWTLSLPENERIQSLIPQVRGPVASIGKVLGNRTTLYKYLNPRLFALLTTPLVADSPNCGLYLVDSLKGSIMYRAHVPSSAGVCDVKVVLSENWLVYHYYEDDVRVAGSAKGYRMVTVELYEGKAIDQKTQSSDMSSFNNGTTDFTAYESAFVFPQAISAMAVTSTKFGITSKDIIVATKNNRIQSFQRRFLDARRPKRKVTNEEAEEFLIQYDPVLPNDARRVLSHNYQVANTQKIITAPALLESTSLVLAFGLDMFLTRVAPSNTFDVLNENFNKLQLVLTVSGLLLAIVITKPMVHRKRLRERWYQ